MTDTLYCTSHLTFLPKIICKFQLSQTNRCFLFFTIANVEQEALSFIVMNFSFYS